jgi:hypothetical protein
MSSLVPSGDARDHQSQPQTETWFMTLVITSIVFIFIGFFRHSARAKHEVATTISGKVLRGEGGGSVPDDMFTVRCQLYQQNLKE